MPACSQQLDLARVLSARWCERSRCLAGRILRFAGKVRAGLVPHVRREVLGKLKPLQVEDCPFANLPDTDVGRWGGGITADQLREMQWTKPQLVAQIRFVEWTAENRLRHAAFLGLRLDKAAREVRQER
jgi:bifunctional non-homologous end joining protein LigD